MDDKRYQSTTSIMQTITVETVVAVNIQTAWTHWNNPDSIMEWIRASADWYCPRAMNNLVVGGTFAYTMAPKNKSDGFDFAGEYTKIEKPTLIEYTITDSRKVTVTFTKVSDNLTKITEIFEMEEEHGEEQQREGWSAILNNFKIFCEEKASKAQPIDVVRI